MTNYYRLLGLRNFSSQDEIKRAYRNLSKRYHPDLNKGDEHSHHKFIEIQQAYEYLKNPVNKAKLDNYLKNPYSYRSAYSSSGSDTRGRTDGSLKSKNRRRYEERHGKTGDEFTRQRTYSPSKDKLDRRSIFLYIVFPVVMFPILFWLFVPLDRADENREMDLFRERINTPPPPLEALRPIYMLDLNGNLLSTYQKGMEEQMVFFLGLLEKQNKNPDDLGETWFAFDRLEFAEGSAKDVNVAGREQLANIARIMEEYPQTNILITVSNLPQNFVAQMLYTERLESIQQYFINKKLGDRVRVNPDFVPLKKPTLNKSNELGHPEFVLKFYN